MSHKKYPLDDLYVIQKSEEADLWPDGLEHEFCNEDGVWDPALAFGVSTVLPIPPTIPLRDNVKISHVSGQGMNYYNENNHTNNLAMRTNHNHKMHGPMESWLKQSEEMKLSFPNNEGAKDARRDSHKKRRLRDDENNFTPLKSHRNRAEGYFPRFAYLPTRYDMNYSKVAENSGAGDTNVNNSSYGSNQNGASSSKSTTHRPNRGPQSSYNLENENNAVDDYDAYLSRRPYANMRGRGGNNRYDQGYSRSNSSHQTHQVVNYNTNFTATRNRRQKDFSGPKRGANKPQEPEWLSEGPSNFGDTIELHGIHEDDTAMLQFKRHDHVTSLTASKNDSQDTKEALFAKGKDFFEMMKEDDFSEIKEFKEETRKYSSFFDKPELSSSKTSSGGEKGYNANNHDARNEILPTRVSSSSPKTVMQEFQSDKENKNILTTIADIDNDIKLSYKQPPPPMPACETRSSSHSRSAKTKDLSAITGKSSRNESATIENSNTPITSDNTRNLNASAHSGAYIPLEGTANNKSFGMNQGGNAAAQLYLQSLLQKNPFLIQKLMHFTQQQQQQQNPLSSFNGKNAAVAYLKQIQLQQQQQNIAKYFNSENENSNQNEALLQENFGNYRSDSLDAMTNLNYSNVKMSQLANAMRGGGLDMTGGAVDFDTSSLNMSSGQGNRVNSHLYRWFRAMKNAASAKNCMTSLQQADIPVNNGIHNKLVPNLSTIEKMEPPPVPVNIPNPPIVEITAASRASDALNVSAPPFVPRSSVSNNSVPNSTRSIPSTSINHQVSQDVNGYRDQISSPNRFSRKNFSDIFHALQRSRNPGLTNNMYPECFTKGNNY